MSHNNNILKKTEIGAITKSENNCFNIKEVP